MGCTPLPSYGRGPAPRSEEQGRTRHRCRARRPATTTCCRSAAALVVSHHLGGSGSASAPRVLQRERTGFTPFRADALPGVRAPLEGSHTPAAFDRRRSTCPPAVVPSLRSTARAGLHPRALDSRALFRGGDRARDRRCRRVPRTLSFHGFLVPLRDQPSNPDSAGFAAARRPTIRPGHRPSLRDEHVPDRLSPAPVDHRKPDGLGGAPGAPTSRWVTAARSSGSPYCARGSHRGDGRLFLPLRRPAGRAPSAGSRRPSIRVKRASRASRRPSVRRALPAVRPKPGSASDLLGVSDVKERV